MDGVRGIHEAMGLDLKKGGQPPRKDTAAESKQRHKNKEPGTGLERFSGSDRGIRVVKKDEDNPRAWIEEVSRMSSDTFGPVQYVDFHIVVFCPVVLDQ